MFGSKTSNFEALVKAYSAQLYRYAYWLTSDRFVAEDRKQVARGEHAKREQHAATRQRGEFRAHFLRDDEDECSHHHSDHEAHL